MTVDARRYLDESPRQVSMTGHARVTRRDPNGLGLEFTGRLTFG